MKSINKPFHKLQARLILYVLILLLSAVATWAVTSYYIFIQAEPSKYSALAALKIDEVLKVEDYKVIPGKKLSLQIPAGYSLLVNFSNKPTQKFVTITEANITVAPKKYDLGTISFVYRPLDNSLKRVVQQVTVYQPEFNAKKLRKDLETYLATKKDNYGIYIYDLQRRQEFGHNHKKGFPPASISKLPAAILTLRDIDAGKRKLTDTYPIQQQYKHGSTDSLAKLANGSRVTIKRLIDLLILESNNTAQYHLRGLLGGSYEALNPRTERELHAKPFYENPHIATPRAIGIALRGVYTRETLSEKSASYLLGLMQTTPPDLRLAIPQSVPKNVKVANKVGFLFGGREGDVYNDSAVVYGPKTDYILVVLNNDAPPYPRGAYIVRDIAEIVYKALES